jgi:hypothetical protein
MATSQRGCDSIGIVRVKKSQGSGACWGETRGVPKPWPAWQHNADAGSIKALRWFAPLFCEQFSTKARREPRPPGGFG